MKRHLLLWLPLAAMLLASCVEHEEIYFEGKVVGGRNCSSAIYDPNMGYVVQLTIPEGVGGTLTAENGQVMTNLVVLYEPDRRIMVEDRVHGRFYWDDKYSRSHCSIRWDEELPEGVITEVIVD